MTDCDYLFVIYEQHGDKWLPRSMNDEELRDWQSQADVSVHKQELHAQGWAVSHISPVINGGSADKRHRLYVFRRPRSRLVSSSE